MYYLYLSTIDRRLGSNFPLCTTYVSLSSEMLLSFSTRRDTRRNNAATISVGTWEGISQIILDFSTEHGVD